VYHCTLKSPGFVSFFLFLTVNAWNLVLSTVNYFTSPSTFNRSSNSGDLSAYIICILYSVIFAVIFIQFLLARAIVIFRLCRLLVSILGASGICCRLCFTSFYVFVFWQIMMIVSGVRRGLRKSGEWGQEVAISRQRRLWVLRVSILCLNSPKIWDIQGVQ